MVDSISNIISESVSVSLEGFVFMEAVPLTAKPEEFFEDTLLWSKIEILDPVKGGMTLVFPEEILNEIIESVYGPMMSPGLDPFADDLDEDMPVEDNEMDFEKIRLDTLAELINTIAGQVMSRVVPEDIVFQLGLPETGEGYLKEEAETGIFYFQMDDHFFCIKVSGDLKDKL